MSYLLIPLFYIILYPITKSKFYIYISIYRVHDLQLKVYYAQETRILSISPNTVTGLWEGASNRPTIQVKGIGFNTAIYGTANMKCTIGGEDASPIQVINANTIICTVPPQGSYSTYQVG